jgi:hypothetical protein
MLIFSVSFQSAKKAMRRNSKKKSGSELIKLNTHAATPSHHAQGQRAATRQLAAVSQREGKEKKEKKTSATS